MLIRPIRVIRVPLKLNEDREVGQRLTCFSMSDISQWPTQDVAHHDNDTKHLPVQIFKD